MISPFYQQHQVLLNVIIHVLLSKDVDENSSKDYIINSCADTKEEQHMLHVTVHSLLVLLSKSMSHIQLVLESRATFRERGEESYA